MLTIKIFNAKGHLIHQAGGIPDDAPPDVILNHVAAPKGTDMTQAFKVRVENEAGKGYWMLLGEMKSPEFEHPRQN